VGIFVGMTPSGIRIVTGTFCVNTGCSFFRVFEHESCQGMSCLAGAGFLCDKATVLRDRTR
jgi:hypothetical protein